MMKAIDTLLLSTTVAAAAACGAPEPTRDLFGTLDLEAVLRRQAELVISDDAGGRSIVEVEPSGRFLATLPVGRRAAFAFRDPADGRFFAHLVHRSQRTTVVVSAGPAVDIGAVTPVEPNASSARDECRSPDPENGSTLLFSSVLVRGERELEPSTEDLGDDDGDHRPDDLDDDSDGNGVCDDDQKEDGISDDRADLPYDVRLEIGDVFRLSDAFLEKGPSPAAVTDVEMDGSTWRLQELGTDTPFEVTEADCAHEGNRGTGRDRAFVTWRNRDGSVDIDHLDLRYCDR